MTIYYTYCSYETDKGDSGLMYIGYRKCPEGKTPWEDDYFGSPCSSKNKGFRDNPNKSKVILGLFDNRFEAMAHEIELHDFYDVVVDPRFANQCKSTSTGFSVEGRMSEEHPRFGKKHSLETIEKISNSNRGKRRSEDTKKKISESRLGEKNPNYGKELSEKQKRKISGALLGTEGKRHTEETKRKISDRMTGDGNPRFDSNLYTFENKDLGILEVQVTRSYMSRVYGLSSSNLGRAINKKSSQHKGWRAL